MTRLTDERIDRIFREHRRTVGISVDEANRRIARAIEAELAQQAEPVAWMIECSSGFTGWWDGRERLDCRFFDTDPNKGVRFATKEQAELVIRSRGNSCMVATAHFWVFAPLPAAPDTVQVPRTKEEAEIMVRLGSMFLEAAPKSTP